MGVVVMCCQNTIMMLNMSMCQLCFWHLKQEYGMLISSLWYRYLEYKVHRNRIPSPIFEDRLKPYMPLLFVTEGT